MVDTPCSKVAVGYGSLPIKRNFFIESVFIGVCLQIFENSALKLMNLEFNVGTFFLFSQKISTLLNGQFDKVQNYARIVSNIETRKNYIQEDGAFNEINQKGKRSP